MVFPPGGRLCGRFVLHLESFVIESKPSFFSQTDWTECPADINDYCCKIYIVSEFNVSHMQTQMGRLPLTCC